MAGCANVLVAIAVPTVAESDKGEDLLSRRTCEFTCPFFVKGDNMSVDQRTFGEKVSDIVTDFGGSWKFIITFSIIMFFWVILNTLSIFDIIAWDRYPFILLNLVLSFVAAFQAPFIMMSQNRAEVKQDEVYRQLFYEIKELVQKGNEHSKSNKEDIRTLRAEIKQLFKS